METLRRGWAVKGFDSDAVFMSRWQKKTATVVIATLNSAEFTRVSKAQDVNNVLSICSVIQCIVLDGVIHQ